MFVHLDNSVLHTFQIVILCPLRILRDVISESAIVCQAKPDDPKIVVLGVNSSVVSLNWKTCSGNAGETFISFSFSRRRPDSIATEKIASRRASEGGFTMEDLFKDKTSNSSH